MKQELGPNQTRWLQALRSGKFKQNHKGMLRTVNDEYCCLGIAAELAGTVRLDPVGNRGTDCYPYGSQYSSGNLTKDTIDWLACRGGLGNARDAKWSALASLNDTGSTFEQIADIVEADPGQYFTEPR